MRGGALYPLIAALLAVAGPVVPAHAQQYPAKPIRIIVPTAAGGMADLSARVLGQQITEHTKDPVVVENRPGANGEIGTEYVARAAPDGYTLLIGMQQTQAILPVSGKQLPYDAARDFVPVVHLVSTPLVLVVSPDVPARTIAELVALAKQKPGSLTYGSAGIGSMGQLSAEQFKLYAGLDIVHVAYKGVAPALQDVIAGHVSMTFDLVPNDLEHIRAGRVRALAVLTPQRVKVLPEVPTMAESGYPDVIADNWFALFAPAKTPPAIVAWLNQQANQLLSQPDVRSRFEDRGAEIPLGTSAALGAHVIAEQKKWRNVLQKAGIHLE